MCPIWARENEQQLDRRYKTSKEKKNRKSFCHFVSHSFWSWRNVDWIDYVMMMKAFINGTHKNDEPARDEYDTFISRCTSLISRFIFLFIIFVPSMDEQYPKAQCFSLQASSFYVIQARLSCLWYHCTCGDHSAVYNKHIIIWKNTN